MASMWRNGMSSSEKYGVIITLIAMCLALGWLTEWIDADLFKQSTVHRGYYAFCSVSNDWEWVSYCDALEQTIERNR